MQVIRRLDTGERQYKIGAALNLAISTRTIFKNKEKILSSATVQQRQVLQLELPVLETIQEMEKRLSIWIDDEIEHNMPLNQSI
ncbi:hypothetical protein TNCV_887831 [Trichonephila clavipes]|nr:hypothetical protein TNCV_887831 [Trichonephila clavipes]